MQRINFADISVDGVQTAYTTREGIILFVAVHRDDTEDIVPKMVDKVLNLRIFENEEGKFHFSTLDIKGDVIVVSQFTLYADVTKGRRPSFFESAPPEKAEHLYNLFIEEVRSRGLKVGSGVFGAKMDVKYNNYGPVSIIIDSEDLKRR